MNSTAPASSGIQWPALQLLDRQWNMSHSIGSGAYGQVSQYISTDGQCMAVKRLNDWKDFELDIIRFLQSSQATDEPWREWVVDVHCVRQGDLPLVVMSMMDGHVSDAAGTLDSPGVRTVLASFATAQLGMLVRHSLTYTDLKETNMMFCGKSRSKDWRLIDLGGFAKGDEPGVSTYPIPGESATHVMPCERVCMWNMFLMAVMFVLGAGKLHHLAHRDAFAAPPSENEEELTPSEIEEEWTMPSWKVAALWTYAKNTVALVKGVDHQLGELLVQLVDELSTCQSRVSSSKSDRLDFYTNQFAAIATLAT